MIFKVFADALAHVTVDAGSYCAERAMERLRARVADSSPRAVRRIRSLAWMSSSR
jgi:hypothetical protein